MTSPTNWQWPIYGLEGVERLERITESFMLSCRGLQVGSMAAPWLRDDSHGLIMEDGGYHTMEFFWTDLVLKQALDLDW